MNEKTCSAELMDAIASIDTETEASEVALADAEVIAAIVG